MCDNNSRRRFLKSSATTLGGALFMPQWMKFVLDPYSVAKAADSCSVVAPSLIPFITINLNGGAALQANYVPRLLDGNKLSADTTKSGYSKMGMGKNPQLATEFGVADGFYNPGFTYTDSNSVLRRGGSGILTGIRDAMNSGTTALASTEVLDKTSFLAACVQSRDDSGENKFAIDGLLTKAGLVGSYLPNLGTQRNETGMDHKAAYLSSPAPLVVKSIDQLVKSVTLDLQSQIAGILNQSTDKYRIASAMKKLSDSQVKKLISTPKDSEIKDLIDYLGLRSKCLVDPQVPSVSFDVNSASYQYSTQLKDYWTDSLLLKNDPSSVVGTPTRSIGADLDLNGAIANAVLNGWVGSACIQLGGFDYHSGNRNRGAQDNLDISAGRLIGNILRMALILNKKIFIYVTTNGSVVSEDIALEDSNGRGWVSDFGAASCVYALYFDPTATGRVSTAKGNQIGGYTSGQVVDTVNTYTGGSPELTAAAIFANYLNLHSGSLDPKAVFQSLVGVRFDMAQWNNIVKFGV
jgi:hypothetical protein